MRDFFERQDAARKRTGLLITLFFMAVALSILSVYAVVSALFFMNNKIEGVAFWDLSRFLTVSFVTLLVVVVGTIYRINQLRDGGYLVAQMLGGRLVMRNTRDIAEKRLMNVVEEMAIASGVPVPDVYVMDQENGINAFAAGHSIDDSIICVTRGALTLLNRDELQGVVAHEFSHILNSDVAINIRLMGWLHGILMLSFIGLGLMRSLGRVRTSRSKGAAAIVLFGAALYILGYIGAFFGTLIKSAVSRQREYLADASAVQFTRNPEGMGGALKKIGGLTHGSILIHPRAGEASHMYISPGLQESLFNVFSTHPPLMDRIKLIDPHFNGIFPKTIVEPVIKPYLEKPGPTKAEREARAARALSGAAILAILDTVGEPMQAHRQMAQQMLAELPEPIMQATREPHDACALIYMLILGPEAEFQKKRLDLLMESESFDIYEETYRLSGHLSALNARSRLPLIDMAMPSLRQLSEEQYRTFKENVNRLIMADGKVSLFEYVLRYVLVRRLDAHFGKTKTKIAQIYSVRGVLHECSVVLSVFAHVGQRTPEETAGAFERGSRVLEGPKVDLELLDTKDCTLNELDSALDSLSVTSPKVKRALLAACLECLVYDEKITIGEVELFRAVTESLGVPAPPWLMNADITEDSSESGHPA
jgi:Zn-dependent protease with chaperone function